MAEQLNDVNVDAMRDFDRKLRENPALGKRTVKVRSSWLRGTKALVEIGEHQGVNGRATPKTRKFIMTTDAPPALGGVDAGPAAVEALLGALAGCLTSGIAANAALFDVPIEGLEIEMEADIDLRGVFGHDKGVRSGFSDIRYTVTIQSPAPEDKVRRCKETIDRKSPVLEVLTKPVKVSSNFVYKQR
ncbi:MAG TPA: OsmC family protein [Candidatus Tectomicrobia bacterium]|nr:OsmC family protein [Candidatus Tectomicrobia bacterium]